MSTPKSRIRVPTTASPGDVVVIKTLLSHPMESGNRRNPEGGVFARKIINSFTCTFDGETVFACTLGSGISANPYLEFSVRVERSGAFVFKWVDDDGSVHVAEAAITVA